MPHLVATGARSVGGYANTFRPVPEDWTLDGDQDTDGLLGLRSDLDPKRYAQHVAGWVEAGANLVGGCCGTRPAHIAKVHEVLLGS
jgi:S-methylmethionine-dependent homocysteine/selenocysteine methylase